MTELDRVCNSDNFNFRGIPSFLQVCEKRFQAMQKKMDIWNVCTVTVLLQFYSKCLGVRLPVCPVNKKKNILML